MAEAARLLCDARATIGETPIAFRDGVLWTDPVSRLLLHYTDRLEVAATDRPIWSLAMLPDGAVAGASDDAFGVMDREDGWRFGPAASLDPGCRFNDMAVDPEGGLWVGAMHRGVLATRGSLYHAASIDARPERVAAGLGVPNGMKLSADGGTLFVVDTLARTLLAYPVQGDGLGEPVIVTDFLELPGKPDGMTIDTDGNFHVAMWAAGASRISPRMALPWVAPTFRRRMSAACASPPPAVSRSPPRACACPRRPWRPTHFRVGCSRSRRWTAA